MKSFLTIFIITINFNSSFAGCVITNNARLRSEANINSEILDRLKIFTPVLLVEKGSSWSKIKTHSLGGWIFNKSISMADHCMEINDPSDPWCFSKNHPSERQIYYKEVFKILTKEIGCNYVQDRYGNKFWLSSFNIWPSKEAWLIKIKSTNTILNNKSTKEIDTITTP